MSHGKRDELERLTRELSVDLGIAVEGFADELARRVRVGDVRETEKVVRWLSLHSAVGDQR